MHHRIRTAAAFAAICLAVAACSGDATAPPKPASVTANSAVSGAGTVGALLVPSPEFVVRDASGNPIGAVNITIAVATGGGTLTGAPTRTASNGVTAVGAWTLGQTAGANSLTVTVSGLPPLVLSATGAADVPARLTLVSGGNQAAPAAGSVPLPVTFKVSDRFNNGVSGVPVTFAVTGGGGSLASTAPVPTDAAGLAAAPAWTLGKLTISQQLMATAATFSATTSASVATNFSLDVRFFGPPMDPAFQAAFTTAVTRIQGIVTGDLADVLLTPAAPLDVSPCGITGVAPLSETIDDVIVFATVATLGPGILGSAGPCFIRSAGGLTLIGVMNFSVTAVQGLLADGRLNDVILHEMLHTLGVGTLWASKGQVTGAGTANSSFIGVQAVAGCQFHGGGANCATTIPLETTGGSGTRDVHWREITSATGIGFRTEMMTGFVSSAGVPNPLSRMSIGSLADIGYVVNMAPFDSYTVPSTLAAALGAIRESQGLGGFELREELREPIGTVDRAGRVTLLPPRR